MKKVITMLLMAAFLITGVAGCGDSTSKPKDKDADPAKPGEKGKKDKPA
jgi:hypothetical protein